MHNPIVHVAMELPQPELQGFLQYLRDFEQRDPDKHHLAIAISAPWMHSAEMLEVFRAIKPPLPTEWVIPLEPEAQSN